MQKSEEDHAYDCNISENNNYKASSPAPQHDISFSDAINDNREEKKSIVIICAVDDEWTNAEEVFDINHKSSKKDKQRTHGFRYTHNNCEGYDIYIVRIQRAGLVSAASITAAAILAFNPQLVAMTGICAGRSDKTKLGDIVVATQTFDYEAGKIEDNGRRDRPKPQAISEDLRIALEEINSDLGNLLEAIPSDKTQNTTGLRIKIHLGEMASGSSVLCNKEEIEKLTQKHDDIRGVDMEAYGVAYAAMRLHKTWIVIKGIQDFGDREKSETEKNYRQCAAYASALLLQKYLKEQDFRDNI